MVKIGYHASHEQFPPSELLEYARAAEAAGFDGAMCSDHLFPWSQSQGHSGFAWSWLGAALEATSLSFGVVNAPGARYHPVVIAQAAATLAQMYPGRFWVAIGSGEALNEHITGEAWPVKSVRNERLFECAEVMRRLWSGEAVTHRGHVTVIDARVYSLPDSPPRLVGAAITPETAEWMGGWADALITVSQERERMRAVISAFRKGGGERKSLLLQVKHSFAPTDEEALEEAVDQWRTNVFPSPIAADLALPSHFEAIAQFVGPDDVRKAVRVSSRLDDHIGELREDVAMGYDEIYVHNVNRRQREFIERFGADVLPALRGSGGKRNG
jgi:coenzyme F420-dependent glucose-6-phosphate dehydrogenase